MNLLPRGKVDVKRVLSVADRLVSNLTAARKYGDSDRKREIQAAIYPDGVVYDEKTVPTSSSALFPTHLGDGKNGNAQMAARRGVEPLRQD